MGKIQVNTCIWKIIYLNCGERHEDMIDHCSYSHSLSSCEVKAWENSDLNRIQTHDLCQSSQLYTQPRAVPIYDLSWVQIPSVNFFHFFCCWLVKNCTLPFPKCPKVRDKQRTKRGKMTIQQDQFVGPVAGPNRLSDLCSNLCGGSLAANWYSRKLLLLQKYQDFSYNVDYCFSPYKPL